MPMSIMSTVAPLATAETEQLRELPMPPWVFGAIALGSFIMLLGVLWSFRNTASKYDTPAGAGHPDAHGSPGSHGATDPGAHH